MISMIGQVIAWLTDPAHWVGPSGIPVRVAEHLALSLTALAVASAIALPVGLWVGHTRRGERVAVNSANIARAIPSLALIGLAVPITVLIDPQFGFRVLPTLIAMIVLAIPPILVNTHAGITGVDPDLTEAAEPEDGAERGGGDDLDGRRAHAGDDHRRRQRQLDAAPARREAASTG